MKNSFLLDFNINYFTKACENENLTGLIDQETGEKITPCQPENSLQFTILMFATVWLSVKIYEFKNT